jgi:beta-lactamase class D
MNEYLGKLNYKNMVFDSITIDLLGLKGDSRITTMEQIDFLTRFYHSKLPIFKRTEKIVKDMIFYDEKPSYNLSGKTGWSIRDGNNVGWYVGYIEKGKELYFIA